MRNFLPAFLLLVSLTAKSQTASFTVSADTVCYGGYVTVVNTSPGAFDSLKWEVNGLAAGGPHMDSLGVTFSLQGANVVKLFVYRSAGVDSASRTIYVQPLVFMPILRDSAGTLVISLNTSETTWYFDTSIIPGETSNSLDAVMAGCYYAIVDSPAGCFSGITDTVCISPAGISASAKPTTAVAIYPNPVTTVLNISSPGMISLLSITNLLGQTVYSRQYNTMQADVDVSGLAPGMYFVVVNGSEVKRFVKE